AQLTGDGLRGRIDAGQLGTLEDATILTPDGKLTVAMTGEGEFTAPAIDPLGPNQYFPGTVLGQRQMSRQAAYRTLAADPDFPTRPVFVGWADRTVSEVKVSEQAQQRARALVVVPLALTPPEPGDPIAVPASLMLMRTFRGDKSLMSAPIFDER